MRVLIKRTAGALDETLIFARARSPACPRYAKLVEAFPPLRDVYDAAEKQLFIQKRITAMQTAKFVKTNPATVDQFKFALGLCEADCRDGVSLTKGLLRQSLSFLEQQYTDVLKEGDQGTVLVDQYPSIEAGIKNMVEVRGDPHQGVQESEFQFIFYCMRAGGDVQKPGSGLHILRCYMNDHLRVTYNTDQVLTMLERYVRGTGWKKNLSGGQARPKMAEPDGRLLARPSYERSVKLLLGYEEEEDRYSPQQPHASGDELTAQDYLWFNLRLVERGPPRGFAMRLAQ